MLHKSFKPAKCKTSLKLAVSRIKLLKNKRDSQVKHLKRELAQLLESGQEQTARIRVEHVVREEKTMAAYDLIEIYCELIVARLPIIESQKNCPIDLKEAISSVIFASPRCADIPELMDVRKHFTAKYGKEFVSAAVELRPDCGVSRLLVEKLSTKAPDGPTKIKILSAIAEEHNVNWDPKLFGEKEMKPPEDLLNGPNTFEQSSKMHVGPRNVQEPLDSVDKGHPNSRAPSKHYEKHDAPVNSHGSYSRLPSHFQNVPFTDKAMPSDTAHPDLRPLGTGSEEMEFRHSYPAERTGYSAGSQSWNMEFKDATAAAQAAAESAERASMAARAAAELSSQGRISRQHSTESKKATVFKSRDEGLHNYASSRLQGEQLAKDPVNNTSRRSNSGMNPEQSFESEQDDLVGLAERFYNLKSSNKSSQLASSKSSNSSVDDYPQVSDSHMADRHSRKTSELEKSDLLGEENIERESSESEKEFASEVHDGMKSDHVGYFQEASIRKQSSSVSSHSHSQIPSDDHNAVSNFSHDKFSEDAVKEPSIFYGGKVHSTTKETNSFENAAAVFDDSASDDDDEFKFDEKGKHNDLSSLYYSSDGRKSSSHLFANTSAKSPRLNMEETLGKSSSQSPFASDWHSSSVFSEHLVSDTVPSRADDLLPMTFDDSDGPSSESEEKLDEPKLVGSTRTGTFPHKDMAYSGNSESTKNESPHSIGSLLAVRENVESNRKTLIQQSALDSDVEEHSERNQAIEVAETDKKFSYGYLHNKQTSHRLPKSQSNSSDKDDLQASGSSLVSDNVQRYQSSDILEDTKPIRESSLETGNKLNFGILTGGLRNKGFRRPPYRRNPSDNSSVSKQAEDNSTRIEQSSSSFKVDFSSGARDQEQFNQMLHPKVTKKPSLGTPAPYSNASGDESDEELPKQTVSSSQEPNTRKAGTESSSSFKVDFSSGARDQEQYNQMLHPKVTKKPSLGTPAPYSDASGDESDEELPKQTVSSSQEPNTRKAGTEVNKRSGLKSYFESDNSEPEEDLPKQTVTSKTLSGPGFSRRTKGFLSNSERNSYSKSRVPSGSSVTADYAVEQKPSSVSSYATETQVKPPSQTRSSFYQGSSEQGSSEEQAPSKPNLQSKRSIHKESSSRRSYSNSNRQNHPSQSKSSDYWGSSEQHRSAEPSKPIPESKRSSHEESLKSSAKEQPSNPPSRTVSSGAESTKTSSSRGDAPSRENSINKASHVHPKLPDYDSFTAHLLSLRQNRQ